MLYDPNWKAPEVTIEPWRILLLDAANLIETKGWCQRRFSDVHGFCVAGAMMHVAGHRSGITKGLARIAEHVGGSAALWNDAPERTKEEVIAMLRQVAEANG